jgi:protein TonB
MEPKKNVKYDIHRRRALLLNIGLAVSLIITICAFEWTISTKPEKIVLQRYDEADLTIADYPRPTIIRKQEIPKPKPVKLKPIPGFNPKETEDSSIEEPADPEIDIDSSEPLGDFTFDDMPEEITPSDTFIVVEHMPEPLGGWQAFFHTLSKNIKYPKQAERTRTSGKVFVQFTVNHHGEPSQFRVLKGVGQGCDEEAMRVLAMTKWKPGKQRGRAVHVKMVQPISFSLKE